MTSDELKDRSKKFGIRIIKMTDKLPQSQVGKIITGQIIRSATSVGANYRAVCRAKSENDFINKLKIVEEEADETLYWLEIISELELIKPELLVDLKKEANELLSIFVKSINTKRSHLNLKS